MGEAKRRGTFEERQAEAIAADRGKGKIGAQQRHIDFMKKVVRSRYQIRLEELQKEDPEYQTEVSIK